jgi:uncharacterized membrane protein
MGIRYLFFTKSLIMLSTPDVLGWALEWELIMHLQWLSYALKVVALCNIGAGILNMMIGSYSWACGNFLFAFALFIASKKAIPIFGNLSIK